VDSADEFYSIMGVLTREMNEFGLLDPNQLVVAVVAVEPVAELSELRDRFTYNITPWAGAVGAARRGLRLLQSDEDTDEDLDEDKMAVTAAFGLGSMLGGRRASVDRDRLNLDISALKQQYSRLRERQRQAHIIISGSFIVPRTLLSDCLKCLCPLCFSCLRETSRTFEAGDHPCGHEPLAAWSDGAEGGATTPIGASPHAAAHAAASSRCASSAQTSVRNTRRHHQVARTAHRTQSFAHRTLLVVHVDRLKRH